MARLNNRWFDVVAYGTGGVLATWYVSSVLAAGRFQYRHRGHDHVFTPESEPVWYWLWVTFFSGIAAFCLFHAIRAGVEIARVLRMDRRIEERERFTDSNVELLPGVHKVTTSERSVTVKIVGADGRQREYHSMDSVPPEIRSQIEALEAEPMRGDEASMVETSRTENAIISKITRRKDITEFKITDASGVENIYHSLEEVPAEVRAAIAEAEAKLRDQTRY